MASMLLQWEECKKAVVQSLASSCSVVHILEDTKHACHELRLEQSASEDTLLHARSTIE